MNEEIQMKGDLARLRERESKEKKKAKRKENEKKQKEVVCSNAASHGNTNGNRYGTRRRCDVWTQDGRQGWTRCAREDGKGKDERSYERR
jgi:hypothetical protein